jgi:hypothetical protein
MMTRPGWSATRLRPNGRAQAFAASLIVAIAACGAPAGAQESEGTPSAWVGVGVGEVCSRSGDATAWSCRSEPVVQSVVIGSPADRVGIMPGDTLVSIDGRQLATATGDKALSALEVGRPIVLVLARGPQRMTITVEPAPWPEHREQVLARTLAASPSAPSSVVSLPRIAIFEDSAAADIEVFVDSAGGRTYAYRFHQPDGSVSEFPAPRIDVPLRLRMTRPGTPDDVIWNAYMIAELARMARGLPDSAQAAEYHEMARLMRERYEAEVAPRLRATYDSALSQARVQLDSLRVSVQVLAPEPNAERLGAIRAYGPRGRCGVRGAESRSGRRDRSHRARHRRGSVRGSGAGRHARGGLGPPVGRPADRGGGRENRFGGRVASGTDGNRRCGRSDVDPEGRDSGRSSGK